MSDLQKFETFTECDKIHEAFDKKAIMAYLKWIAEKNKKTTKKINTAVLKGLDKLAKFIMRHRDLQDTLDDVAFEFGDEAIGEFVVASSRKKSPKKKKKKSK